MLEVLVSMAILSIGIVSVLKAFSSSTLTCKAAEMHSNMALLAQQVAGQLERESQLQTGPMSGEFGSDLPEYTWEADVQQSGQDNFYRVDIRVIRDPGNDTRPQVYRLITCLRSEPQQESSPQNPSGNPSGGMSPTPGPGPGPGGP